MAENDFDAKVLPEWAQEIYRSAFPPKWNSDVIRMPPTPAELKHLFRELAQALEALRRIAQMETELPGLRPQFYGHASAIARKAIKEIEGAKT